MFKLQNIRHARHIKWPIYIMFGFIIVSFIFFYGWNQSGKERNGAPTQTFAKLRSESLNPLHRWHNLTNQELHGARQDAQAEMARLLPQQISQFISQQNAWERLLTTRDVARTAANSILIERAARQMNVSATTQEIIDMLKAQPGLTDEMLNEEAQRRGLADEYQLVESIRRQQQDAQVREIKSLVVHASLFELWQEYSLANEKLVLRMAAYPTESFESKATVTQKDLEDYLAKNKKEFHVPTMRRYAYVKVSKADIANALKPTDKEIQAYYEANKGKYTKKAASHVLEISSPMGENQVSTAALAAFRAVAAEAAKQADWTTLTQNLQKQYKGTEFFKRDAWLEDENQERTPQFMAKVKALSANKGTTTVADNEGIHLIRVLEQRKETISPLADVKARVLADYKDAEAEKRFTAEVERFKAEHKKLTEDKASTASLRVLAQRLKLKDELTTSVPASESTIPGIGSLESDKEYIAGRSVGELSDVIATPEVVTALEVVDEKPEYDPKLAEIKGKVETAVRKQKSVELAKAAADQGLSLVKSGADFNQALAKAPKPPFQTSEVTRLEPVETLGAPLIDFKTLQVSTGSLGVSPYGQSAEKPQGYAVWKVEKVVAPKQEEFAKERQRFEQDYLQVQREALLREWLADERAKNQYQFIEAERK